MIDKARMNDRGELGAYLLGHSPVDSALLTRAGITNAVGKLVLLAIRISERPAMAVLRRLCRAQ